MANLASLHQYFLAALDVDAGLRNLVDPASLQVVDGALCLVFERSADAVGVDWIQSPIGVGDIEIQRRSVCELPSCSDGVV